MHSQFPQGYINTKRLARRCPHCKEYITKDNGTKMNYHLLQCDKNPDNYRDNGLQDTVLPFNQKSD